MPPMIMDKNKNVLIYNFDPADNETRKKLREILHSLDPEESSFKWTYDAGYIFVRFATSSDCESVREKIALTVNRKNECLKVDCISKAQIDAHLKYFGTLSKSIVKSLRDSLTPSSVKRKKYAHILKEILSLENEEQEIPQEKRLINIQSSLNNACELPLHSSRISEEKADNEISDGPYSHLQQSRSEAKSFLLPNGTLAASSKKMISRSSTLTSRKSKPERSSVQISKRNSAIIPQSSVVSDPATRLQKFHSGVPNSRSFPLMESVNISSEMIT
jgi:hypothetical protein